MGKHFSRMQSSILTVFPLTCMNYIYYRGSTAHGRPTPPVVDLLFPTTADEKSHFPGLALELILVLLEDSFFFH
jgi:hypothetical protein